MIMGTLLDLIIKEEGIVDHLYLDTRGNVTCGVGRLISRSGQLGEYSWSDFGTALRDFNMLQQMKRDCQYGLKWPATRYAPLCRARMLNPREGLAETIELLDKELTKRLSWFEAQPIQVQYALIDAAYNLGVSGLLKGYPKMLAALAAGDYLTAAKESHRKGISDDRNRRTADRIRSASAAIGLRPGRGA